MAAPSEVLELVERFDRNADAYRCGQYNEAQIRREFIDPLFEHGLGWDVQNKKGYAEAYKDVIHEDAITMDTGARGPGYRFCIGWRKCWTCGPQSANLPSSWHRSGVFLPRLEAGRGLRFIGGRVLGLCGRALHLRKL